MVHWKDFTAVNPTPSLHLAKHISLSSGHMGINLPCQGKQAALAPLPAAPEPVRVLIIKAS